MAQKVLSAIKLHSKSQSHATLHIAYHKQLQKDDYMNNM